MKSVDCISLTYESNKISGLTYESNKISSIRLLLHLIWRHMYCYMNGLNNHIVLNATTHM
jgi:hypothetical protein